MAKDMMTPSTALNDLENVKGLVLTAAVAALRPLVPDLDDKAAVLEAEIQAIENEGMATMRALEADATAELADIEHGFNADRALLEEKLATVHGKIKMAQGISTKGNEIIAKVTKE